MWRKSEDYSHCMQLSKWLQQLLGMFECLNSPLHDCAALVVHGAGVTTHWSCLTVSFFLFLLSCIAFAAGGDNTDLGGRWFFCCCCCFLIYATGRWLVGQEVPAYQWQQIPAWSAPVPLLAQATAAALVFVWALHVPRSSLRASCSTLKQGVCASLIICMLLFRNP